MSIPLIINGATFQYPEPGDSNWGSEATGWASAVTNGMLQKAGGAFTLTAELDFGANFGLKALYYKTETANIATAGQIRLAQADVISWRNAAGAANLNLSVSTDQLFFNGNQIVITGDLAAYQPLDAELTALAALTTNGIIAKTAAGTVATRTITGTANRVTVTNGDAVAGEPTLDIGTDVVTLSGAQTLINKTISGALNTISNVSLATDVTGTLPIASGGTGQTAANPAFNALSPLTTKGDLVAYSTVNARVPVGGNGQVLTADSSQTTGVVWASIVAGSSSMNIRAPEGAGTTTLISADNLNQRFDLTADRDVVLPTTGVLAGYIYVIANPNAFSLSIKASDASLIVRSWGDQFSLVALTSTPVSSADWSVISKTTLLGRTWQNYTPTFVGLTDSDVVISYRRVETTMEIQGHFIASSLSGSVHPTMSLPAGLNIDTAVVNASRTFNLGYFSQLLSATTGLSGGTSFGALTYKSDAGVNVLSITTETTGFLYDGSAANVLISNGASIAFRATVPIAEWSET